MNIIAFSDTHLTHKFDSKKYKAIIEIIKNADKIIINGDFWDSYLTTFEKFYSSKWSMLFPQLKNRNTTYIFGNHDKREDNNLELMKSFCNKFGESFDFLFFDKKYHIEHGDKFFFNCDDRLKTIQQKTANFIFKSGTLIFKEAFWKIYHNQNKKIYKNLIKKYKNEIIVASHTHYSETIEQNFYNTGIVNYGLLQYVLINEKGTTIIKKRY